MVQYQKNIESNEVTFYYFNFRCIFFLKEMNNLISNYITINESVINDRNNDYYNNILTKGILTKSGTFQ